MPRDGEVGRAESRVQKEGRAQRAAHSAPRDAERDPAACDLCGVSALVWRKCKLVCENCGAINKTCADL
ncbi:MAG TPA: hypothetical protein VFK39_11800 [Gemmatimonadaceae bacterium]|nr:hypothetical protein [Gemmatimonadaceae bacterium]